MNRLLLLLVTTLSVALVPVAMAQKVHAVLVADTRDTLIGDGIEGNLNMMQALLDEAKTTGQIDMDVHVVAGTNFNCTNINKAVAGLNVGDKDTVLFYYAGHGSASPTKFPDFYCSKRPGNFAGEEAGMPAVVKALSKRKPQFLIVIADACNQIPALGPLRGAKPAAFPIVPAAAWRRLFLRYKGKLLMSGSVRGQWSFYRTGDELASGLFTRQLIEDGIIKTMSAVAFKNNPNLAKWSTIHDAAMKPFEIVPPYKEPTPPYREQSVQQPESDGRKTFDIVRN